MEIEIGHPLGGRTPQRSPRPLHELLDVLIVNLGDACSVLGNEVIQRGGLSVLVEGSMAIREQDECHSARPEHSVDIRYEPEGFRDMFDDMAADHEVLASIAQGTKPVCVEIRHNVWSRECGVWQLGKECPVLTWLPSIYVLDGRPWVGHGERRMPGAEFDSRSDEVARQQAASERDRRRTVCQGRPLYASPVHERALPRRASVKVATKDSDPSGAFDVGSSDNGQAPGVIQGAKEHTGIVGSEVLVDSTTCSRPMTVVVDNQDPTRGDARE